MKLKKTHNLFSSYLIFLIFFQSCQYFESGKVIFNFVNKDNISLKNVVLHIELFNKKQNYFNSKGRYLELSSYDNIYDINRMYIILNNY